MGLASIKKAAIVDLQYPKNWNTYPKNRCRDPFSLARKSFHFKSRRG